MKIYYDNVDKGRLEGLKTFTEDDISAIRTRNIKPPVGFGKHISSKIIDDTPSTTQKTFGALYEHTYEITLKYVIVGENGVMRLLKDSGCVITEEEGKLWLRYHDDY